MAAADTGFDKLASAGAENAVRQAQARSAMDMLQRKFLYDQYANLANQPLPDQKADPEGYQKALDSRAKALEMQQKVYSPDHHASLAEHLHGLIFGKPQFTPAPQSSPQIPAVKDELGVPYPGTGEPSAPAHPFANNPAYTGILNRLEKFGKGIENHLSAAVHPPAKPDTTDWKAMAAAETPAEREAAAAQADEERKQKYALELEAAKAQDAQDLADKKKRPQLKSYEMPDGTTQWLDASDPTKIPPGAKAIVLTGKPKDSTAALATYIRAKYGENPTWQQIAEGTAEHQRLMAGMTVGSHQSVQFDDIGVPHIVTLTSTSKKEFSPGVSSQAPQVPTSDIPSLSDVNAGIQANKGKAGAPSRKAARVSSQAPQLPGGQLNFRKATPAGTKAKEAVDTAENSYLDVQKASQDPTPVGDQGVILAWLRGRVNRVTQSEIASVNNLGGAKLRLEGSLVKLESGKMTDQQRKWFLRSAKDNYDNARTVASKYSSPVSSSAPQVPVTWSVPKDAPPAPKEDNKLLKDGSGNIIAKSRGGSWVQP